MEFPESDHKFRLPHEHYMKLYREFDPEAASLRAGIPFENGSFAITLMNRRYSVSFPDFVVTPLDPDAPGGKTLAESAPAQILLLRYLTGGTLLPMQGEFIAYRDVPWGETYAANFNGRCILRLARGFGYKPESFERGMEMLGALRTSGGDAAFTLEFLPSLLIKLIMWYGDEEFPPSAQILFSDNFPVAFSADDIAYTGDIVLDALKAVQKLIQN